MLLEQFYELWAKKMAGELSESENKEFLDTLENFPAYKEVYERLETTSMSPLSEEDVTRKLAYLIEANPDVYNTSFRASYLIRKKIFLAAASLIGIVIMLALVKLWFRNTSHRQTQNLMVYNKPNALKGEIKKILLPDSSTIILNSNSYISWNAQSFGKSDRHIRLVGEAFFDIKKDTSKPFIIQTDLASIKVLGTAFNVKSYQHSGVFETSLFRGKIELAAPNGKRTEKMVLVPNQKITIGKMDAASISIKKEEIAHTSKIKDRVVSPDTAWMVNTFIWNNASMADVKKDLENYFDVKIVVGSDEVSQYRFSGQVSNSSLSFVLNALSNVRTFKYKTTKNNEILIY